MLVAMGGYKWVLTLGIDTDSGQGYACLMVDENAQNTVKELEQKILHQFGLLTIISLDQGTHFTVCNVQQWAEKYSPLSTSLIEDWNGHLKHWLSKMEENKGMKAGFTHLHECLLILNGGGELEECPHWIDSSIFLVDLGK